MLFCYYSAAGLGEIAKNIIDVIFRLLTLFDIYISQFLCICSEMGVFINLRNSSFHKEVTVTN